MGSRVRSFTRALRSKARSPVSVQLLWLGPQPASGLYTRPLHHAPPLPGTRGLCHMASLGDVPGNS